MNFFSTVKYWKKIQWNVNNVIISQKFCNKQWNIINIVINLYSMKNQTGATLPTSNKSIIYLKEATMM